MNPFTIALRRLLASCAAGTPVGLLLSLAEPPAVAVAGGAAVAIGVFLLAPHRKESQ